MRRLGRSYMKSTNRMPFPKPMIPTPSFASCEIAGERPTPAARKVKAIRPLIAWFPLCNYPVHLGPRDIDRLKFDPNITVDEGERGISTRELLEGFLGPIGKVA